jgi:hypothetical protein
MARGRERAAYALLLAVLIPAGIGTKLYTGPAADWVNASLGGVLYVVFWTLLVLLLRPRWPPLRAALGVLLVTCALEVLQLWHPAWLAPVRAGFIGHALLGNTFAWLDFPHYVAGAVLGWSLALGVRRLGKQAVADA